MKRTLGTRTSLINGTSSSASAINVEPSDRSADDVKAEYVHLLKNNTLDEIRALLENKPKLTRLVIPFLVDGTMPHKTEFHRTLLEWLLFNREPDIFLACMALAGTTTLVVNKKNAAKTLLEAVQSREVIPDFKLAVECTHDSAYYRMVGPGPESDDDDDEEPDNELMELLVATLGAKSGPKKVFIEFDARSAEYLSKLLAPLGCVKDLELETDCGSITLAQLHMFTELTLRNDQIKSFRLNLSAPAAPVEQASLYEEAVGLLLDSMKAQTRLQRLALQGVQESAQKVLSEVVAKSESLICLEIRLKKPVVSQALLAALRLNKSITSFTFEVESIEDDVLPLISLFTENNCSAKKFVLKTAAWREDGNDFQIVSQMIRSNRRISSFLWHLKHRNDLDLASLALALEHNRSLEEMAFHFEGLFSPEEVFAFTTNASVQIPCLVTGLSKNPTLTSFVCSYEPFLRGRRQLNLPQVDAILWRNKSYRDYACSAKFVGAAVGSVFGAFSIPGDVAERISANLLEQSPHAMVGSLALLNKETYGAARTSRQGQALEAIAMALSTGQSEADEKTNMLELLRRIAATRTDFSDDDLRRIATSPFLGYALHEICTIAPADGKHLKEWFINVVGAELMDRKFRLEEERRKAFVSEEEELSDSDWDIFGNFL